MNVRPSTKFVKLGYALCALLAAGIAALVSAKSNGDGRWWWALIVPAFLFGMVLARHIEKTLTTLTIDGERLQYQSGLLSKTTRTMELAKVQDVRVDQTLGQRLAGLGDVSFETAGSSSRIVIRSVDAPQAAADHILELARKAYGGK